jgi:hypothetical protein
LEKEAEQVLPGSEGVVGEREEEEEGEEGSGERWPIQCMHI